MGPSRLSWTRRPRRLVAVFLVVTVLPAIGLVWLAWGLIVRDAELAKKQLRDRLETAATLVADQMQRDLDGLDPATLALAERDGALSLTLSHDGVRRHDGAPLLFAPVPLTGPEPPSSTWQTAEAAEAKGNRAAARDIYRRLTEVDDPAVRAGALVRLGRVYRVDGRTQDAIGAWDRMNDLDDVLALGWPASLQGALAVLRELQARGRHDEYAVRAARVRADLRRGRWQVDRLTFDAAWSAVATAGSDPADDLSESRALASAVEDLHRQWRTRSDAVNDWIGRRAHDVDGHPIVLVWRGDASNLHVVAATPRFFVDRWQPLWVDRRVHISIDDVAGRRIVGGEDEVGGPVVTWAVAKSGLPWTLRVASVAPGVELDAFAARRHLLLLALTLAAVVVIAGAWVVARGVRRDVEVAQLQSNFVSAVSHEFRTPLTSMSHLIELLQSRPGIDDARRTRYYEALAQEAARLRRFVDQLLDFGRVDAGAAQYRLEPVDAVVFVRTVVDRFREGPAARGHAVTCAAAGDSVWVRADPESLALALHNLLENAAKYSPADRPIRVEVAPAGASVSILVRDEGEGIPAAERDVIFDKFVRGARATASGVRGTGVGLALAREIVRAHGGDIGVESVEGRGSTFTMVLPTSPADEVTGDVPSLKVS